MSFEIIGKLHKVFEVQAKSDRFQTREFVITTDGQYPQFIKFQLTQDRCELISNFEEGKDIKVYFDLRGREWQEKYFTNLNAWKLESAATETVADNSTSIPLAVGEPPEMGNFPTANDSTPANTELDDLPF